MVDRSHIVQVSLLIASMSGFMTTRLSANTPLPEIDSRRARELVEQLGSPNYRRREEAANQLVKMGAAIESILREGLEMPNPEIRSRCRQILPLALSYDLERRLQRFLANQNDEQNPPPACWTKFREMVGDSPAARELFAAMHRLDTQFLIALDRNPGSIQQKMVASCMEVMQMQNYGANFIVPAERLALLLFAAIHPKLKNNVESQSYLGSALLSMSYRQPAKVMMQKDPIIRTLILKFILEGGVYAANNGLYLLSNLEMKETAEVARNFLKRKDVDSYSKSMAVALLGKFGGKEAIPEVLPYLSDKTNLGETRFGNGNPIRTQMRDVALATLVSLTGQNPADYDFAYLKMFNGGRVVFQVHQNPTLMGFSDEATREAALKKWRDWYDKNKESLLK
jgi:HEAT repeat protein